MKKRLCVAAAGAVLSAGLVGGASFGVTSSAGDNTVRCARLSARVSLLEGLKDAATAQGQTGRAARIDNEIARLHTRQTNLGC